MLVFCRVSANSRAVRPFSESFSGRLIITLAFTTGLFVHSEIVNAAEPTATDSPTASMTSTQSPTPTTTPTSTPTPTPNPDKDGDGIDDNDDNCPDDPNENQEDQDGDGIGDVCDNCAEKSNRNQKNSDGDGHGNACDNCDFKENDDQSDLDQDGKGDVCDKCGNGIKDSGEQCDPGVDQDCSKSCKLPKAKKPKKRKRPKWTNNKRRPGSVNVSIGGIVGPIILTPGRKGRLGISVELEEFSHYEVEDYTVSCLELKTGGQGRAARVAGNKKKSRIKQASAAMVTGADGRRVVSGQFMEEKGKKKKQIFYGFNTEPSGGDKLDIAQLLKVKNRKVPTAEPKHENLEQLQSRMRGKSTEADLSMDKALRAMASRGDTFRSSQCGTEITVLAAYTTAAIAQNGGDKLVMAADIAAAVCQASQYLEDSQIAGSYRLAGLVEVPDSSSGKAVPDLKALSNFGDGWNDGVAGSLRSADADFLALIVEDTGEWGSEWCGFAWIMQEASLSFATTPNFGPYSANSLWCIKYTETLAHELGHNLGMHHNKNIVQSGSRGLFDDSYGHKWSGMRSIMAYPPGARSHLFSNPAVGSGASGANNARAAAVSIPLAACFNQTR